MASVATVWQLRPGGNDANGGGFDPTTPSAGTDWTKQNAAQYSLAGLTTSGVGNVVNSALAANDWVGNYFQLTTVGTNFVLGFYRIVSVVVGVSFTVDNGTSANICTVGAGSGGAGQIGGAVLRLDKIIGTTQVATSGNIVWTLNGADYTNTTAQTIGADGSKAGGYIHIIGHTGNYQDTIGGIDETLMPVITSATTGIAPLTFNSATYLRFKNIKTTQTFGTPTSRGAGFVLNAGSNNAIIFENCVSDGCGAGWQISSITGPVRLFGCTARNAKSTTLAGFHVSANSGHVLLENCASYGNTFSGFVYSQTSNTSLLMTMQNCISANNGTSGLQVAPTTGSHTAVELTVLNCIFHANPIGILSKVTSGSANLIVKNCIFSQSTTAHLSADTASVNDQWQQINNAFYTTAGVVRNANLAGYILGDITLTADPFTSVSVKDFRLNSTAGAGASCKAAGIPAQIGVLNTVDETLTYRDIGSAQAQAGSAAWLRKLSFNGDMQS